MTKQAGPPVKRHRSPNYPTVGLKEAIDRVRNLYNKDGKAGAPAEIAAVHIGFGKPHGQAMSVLAALKRFGLVAESNGRIAPTQRAIEILNLPPTDPRCQKALRDAVLEPALYRELIEQHKDTGWPADDVLASELVTYKNFNPRAVEGFVRDFKDSVVIAGLSEEGALESEEEADPNVPETDHQPTKANIVNLGGSSSGKAGAGSKLSQTHLFSWPLSKGVTAEVRFLIGPEADLSTTHLERLRQYLELVKMGWEETRGE
ncbi:MAG: hypothetical protein JWO19_5315 [Bryobacterales bacterium]|nr:hypothetical protein [Bryobacterales bacterium]